MAVKTKVSNKKTQTESIDFYDDKNHNYVDFWVGRDYEHNSEIVAINKLLKGKHFDLAMDYGGGYGRVSPTILQYCSNLILVDPSNKQLDIAKDRLREYKNVSYLKVDQKDYVPAEDNSLDLLVMIRVSHHLQNPEATIKDISRTLKVGGMAIIEIANEAHFINRLKYLKKLKNVPKESIAIGQRANGIQENTPFYNHNPKIIHDLFERHQLHTINKLSVSNFRNQHLKKHLTVDRMVALEKFFQGKLKAIDFGPSIFFLVEKRK